MAMMGLMASVLTLSGCSLIWALPAQGAAALIAAALLAFTAGTLSSSHHKKSASGAASVRGEAAGTAMELPAQRATDGVADKAGPRGEPISGSAITIIAGDGFTASLDAAAGVPDSRAEDAEEILGDGIGDSAAFALLARTAEAHDRGYLVFSHGRDVATGSGHEVSPACRDGDAHGDGIADVIMAAWLADPFGAIASPAERLVIGAGRTGDSSTGATLNQDARDAAAHDGSTNTIYPGADGIAPSGFIYGDGFDGIEAPQAVLAGNWERLNPVEGDPEAIAQGGITFNTRCGTYCHGGRGIGGACPNLVDEFWIHGESDADVYRTIIGGAPGTRMGAFGGSLTLDEIWNIIAYLRHRKGQFLLEKAGPGSLREKTVDCPDEAVATIVTTRNRHFEGILVIEDKVSLTVEDRSGRYPARYRIKKDRIESVEVRCADATKPDPSGK